MKSFVYKKILLMFVLLIVSGCTDEISEETAMPEINDENCKPSSLEKITNKAVQQELAGLCIRRGKRAHSKPIAW